MNTIYSVKADGKATVYDNLTSYEKKLFDFITSESTAVGRSIGAKKFIQMFSEWDSDKMTVKASTLASASTLKKVCKAIAHCVSNGEIIINALPTVRANKQHGTYSVDFVSIDNIKTEYKCSELKVREKKEVNAFDFITAYIQKHSAELDKQALIEVVNSIM